MIPDSAHVALQLDQLLTHPDAEALVDELNAGVPVWLRDQHTAAATDAGRVLTAEATLLGASAEQVTVTAIPEWLRLDLLSTVAAWSAGRARTCTHDPHPDRPTAVYAAAWRPELITCGRCLHLINLRLGSAADRRCDRCGRITAGVEHGDGIHPIRVQYGPVLYAAGACHHCHDHQEAAA